MKVTDLKKTGNLVTLTAEEDYAELEKSMDKKFKELVKRVHIPGFRQGKAPKNIFISNYGKARLSYEAMIDMINVKYPLFVDENNLEVIDQPKDFDIVQLEDNKPVIIKLSVEVKPDVKIPKCKGLKFEKEAVNVSKDDVQKELEKLLEKYAKYEEDEQVKIKEGDLITADVVASLEGEELAEWTKNGEAIKVGSHLIHEDYDKAFLGLKSGESKKVKIKFDKNSPHEKVRNKIVEFEIKINIVKTKILPELNDKFIADNTSSMTLDDHRKQTEEKLRANMEVAADNKLKDDVSTWIIDNIKVEVPEVLIQKETDYLVKRMENGLRMYNIDLDTYLKMTQKTLENIRTDYRTEAEKTVKLRLGLEALAKEEKIVATEEDIADEMKDMVKDEKDEEKKKNMLKSLEWMKESIKETVVNKKVVDYILANAKIKQKK